MRGSFRSGMGSVPEDDLNLVSSMSMSVSMSMSMSRVIRYCTSVYVDSSRVVQTANRAPSTQHGIDATNKPRQML